MSNIRFKRMLERGDRARPTAPETRQRILDAAERLFAEEGFARTSLRAVTLAAGVNVAAVHYHYGSKEALAEAVFARRVVPVNAERLAWLDRLEAAPSPPTVAQVLEAFIAPTFRAAAAMGEGDPSLSLLIARFYAEPEDVMERMVREQFGEVGRRFTASLGRLLPHLQPSEVSWRFQFTLAAMTHVLSGRHRFEVIPGLRLDGGDDDAIRRLVAFCVPGFAAPAVSA